MLVSRLCKQSLVRAISLLCHLILPTTWMFVNGIEHRVIWGKSRRCFLWKSRFVVAYFPSRNPLSTEIEKNRIPCCEPRNPVANEFDLSSNTIRNPNTMHYMKLLAFSPNWNKLHYTSLYSTYFCSQESKENFSVCLRKATNSFNVIWIYYL